MERRVLDRESLKAELAAGSKWALKCGEAVKVRRETLGLSPRHIATVIDIPVQTIYRIEAGQLVPKDYLRLALAHALACEVVELFPLLSRAEVAGYMDAA